MTNPYQPPDVLTEQPEPVARKDASLVWFVASLSALVTFRFMIHNVRIGMAQDMTDSVFESLQDAGPLVIPAVLIYTAARYVFRTRYDYASTRFSLVVVGAIAALYLSVCQYWDYQRPWTDDLVWYAGAIIALPFAVGVVAVERKLIQVSGLSNRTFVDEESIPVREQTAHESILWFSATIFVIVFVITPIENLREFRFSAFVEYTEMSAMMSLMFTAIYGALSVCAPRKTPATRASRIVAAIVYTGTLWISGQVLQDTLIEPWMVILALIFPVCLAVPADRLVARYAGAA